MSETPPNKFQKDRKKINIIVGLFIFCMIAFSVIVFYRINTLASFSIDDSYVFGDVNRSVISLPFSFPFESRSEKAESLQWTIVKRGSIDTIHSSETKFIHTFEEVGEYEVTLIAIGREDKDTKSKNLIITLADEYKQGVLAEITNIIDDKMQSNSKILSIDELSELTVFFNNNDPSFKVIINGKEKNGFISGLNFLKNDRLESYEIINSTFDDKGKLTGLEIKGQLIKVEEIEDDSPSGSIADIGRIEEESNLIKGTEKGEPIFNSSFLLGISNDTRVNVGDEFTFKNNSVNAIRYEWDFNGDGKIDSTEENPTYTFTKKGKNKIILFAINAKGERMKSEKDIDVFSSLMAKFNIPSGKSFIDREIGFNNKSSRNVKEYNWDFGDGETSNSSSPQHTYTEVGKFNVKLKVKDKYGNVETTKDIVHIKVSEDVLSKKLTEIAVVCSEYQQCKEARNLSKKFLTKYFKGKSTIPVYESKINVSGMKTYLKRVTVEKKTKDVLIKKITIDNINYDNVTGKISEIYLTKE